jgi:hypothetical protein
MNVSDTLRNFLFAQEARRNAHRALHERLPGWRIYFKAEMNRAIRKWRAYVDSVRAMQ